MPAPLLLSLSAYGGVPTRHALDVFTEAGIQDVEISIGPTPDHDAPTALKEYHRKGMRFRGHHAFVMGRKHHPINTTDKDLNWPVIDKMLDFLASVGVTAYSVHPGSYRNPAYYGGITSVELIEAYDHFRRNMLELNRRCQLRGMALGFETMYHTPATCKFTFLMQTSQEIRKFIRDVDGSGIKLVVDAAHLNIWPGRTLTEKLALMGMGPEQVLEIHLSDNDGVNDIHCPLSETTWFRPWAHTIHPDVPVVLESRLNKQPPEVVRVAYAEALALIGR